MRKFVKKIATVVASLTMISAMGISAFAIEPYSFVGNPNLFNEPNAESTEVGWVATSEDQIMTAVEGMEGVYKYTSTYVTATDDAEVDDTKRAERRQFKIVAEGPDMAWSYQMSFGNPDPVWADNMTQFQIEGIKDGEFVVYLKPANGYVCVIQDKQALDLLIRFHSRDEDQKNFVEPTIANIVAEGYAESDTGLVDADYAAFVNECVVAEGGTAASNDETTAGNDETTAGNDETTAGNDETTADNDETKKAADDKEDEEESGISTPVIIVIVVAVVAVIAIIVVVSKKKK